MIAFLNKNPIAKFIQIIVCVGLTVFIAYYFSLRIVDPLHDGIMLKPAVDVAQGKILFKDTFTQYGALTTMMQAKVLTLFGERLTVLKYLTVGFYGVIAFFLWIIWATFMPPLLSTLAVLIWVGLFPFGEMTIFFAPWSSVYALLCQLIALQLLIVWAQKRRGWMLFVVGALAALAFWFRQPIGVFLFAAVLLFAFLLKIKRQKSLPIIPLIFGFLFIHMLFLYWLIQNGSLTYWWSQSIAFASSWEKAVATQYRFPIFQMSQMLPRSYSAVSIWVLFPAMVLYQGYIILKQKKLSTFSLQLLAAVCISLFSWLQYYPMNDPSHCLWAATPFIGFFVYTAWNNKYKGSKHFLIFLLFLILLAPDIFNGSRNAKNRLKLKYMTFTENSVLKGMKENEQNYLYYQALLYGIQEYEKTHPQTFVVSLTVEPLYNLLGQNHTNCSRYFIDWNWKIFSPALEREYRTSTRSCIQKYQPLVITDKGHFNPSGYKRTTPVPPLKCNSSDPVAYLMAPAPTTK
jgi:hypothetical protein